MKKILLILVTVFQFYSLSVLAQVSTGNGQTSIQANNPNTNLRLGIGVLNPIHPLHIVCGDYNGGATGSANQVLSAQYPNNGIFIDKTTGSSAASLYLQYNPAAGGRRWALSSAGTGNSGVGNFIISDLTSAADRLTIRPNGNVGIGTSNPTQQFHTTGGVVFQGLTPNNSLNQIVVRDASGMLFVRDASTLGNNNAWSLNGNSVGMSNFLGTTNAADLRIATSNFQRMVVTASGEVGINTTTPTASFHTNGTVRFENLPSGVGNALVVDANGNVRVAQSIIYKTGETEEIKAEMLKLKEEIKQLSEALKNIAEESNKKNTIIEADGDENHNKILTFPNPTNGISKVNYTISSFKNSAMIKLYNSNGLELFSKKISSKGNGNFEVDLSKLANGVYYYVLYIDEVKSSSKKLIIAK